MGKTKNLAMRHMQSILRNVRPIIQPSHSGGVPDAFLLERFLGQRDEAAFELLVHRHGPMVMAVCGRVLTNTHDAEDAFQATFLTLAQKAGSIGKRESVSSWLYQVAYRTALRAKSRAARRGRHEKGVANLALLGACYEPADEPAWRELRGLLDAEVDRLPEKYRAAFVLCFLEGKTNEEAAELLGCPKGTVQSRLSRARERLRARLGRRGLTLTSAALAALLLDHGPAAAAAPAELVQVTVRAAMGLVTGNGVGIAPAVLQLLTEVQKELALRKGLRAALLVLLLLAGGAAGVNAYAALAEDWRPPFSNPQPISTESVPKSGGGCH